MVIMTESPASMGDPSPLPMACILHPAFPHPTSPHPPGAAVTASPQGSLGPLLPKKSPDPMQPGSAELPGVGASPGLCRALRLRPGRAGRSGKAPRARTSSRGPRASTRTLTSRQQWLTSRRWTLTLVLIFIRHFTMAARAAAGLACGSGCPQGLRGGVGTAARPPAPLTQAALEPLALGSGLFWAPSFPWDQAEVRVKKSSCWGRGGAGKPCQLRVIYCGRLFNALATSQQHAGERVLTFNCLQGCRSCQAHSCPQNQHRYQPWDRSMEINTFPALRDLSIWAGSISAPCPCCSPGSRISAAVLGQGLAPQPIQEQGTTAGCTPSLSPRSLPSPVPRPPSSFTWPCHTPAVPTTHTLLSITPASLGIRHCCHQRAPQLPPAAQPQPPALSPAPRGHSRAGPNVLPSANSPSQVHPTPTRP